MAFSQKIAVNEGKPPVPPAKGKKVKIQNLILAPGPANKAETQVDFPVHKGPAIRWTAVFGVAV